MTLKILVNAMCHVTCLDDAEFDEIVNQNVLDAIIELLESEYLASLDCSNHQIIDLLIHVLH